MFWVVFALAVLINFVLQIFLFNRLQNYLFDFGFFSLSPWWMRSNTRNVIVVIGANPATAGTTVDSRLNPQDAKVIQVFPIRWWILILPVREYSLFVWDINVFPFFLVFWSYLAGDRQNIIVSIGPKHARMHFFEWVVIFWCAGWDRWGTRRQMIWWYFKIIKYNTIHIFVRGHSRPVRSLFLCFHFFGWICKKKPLTTLNGISWADALVQSKACEFRFREKGYLKYAYANKWFSFPFPDRTLWWWNNNEICVGEKGNFYWLIRIRFNSRILTFLRKIFNESPIRIESFFCQMLIYPMHKKFEMKPYYYSQHK